MRWKVKRQGARCRGTRDKVQGAGYKVQGVVCVMGSITDVDGLRDGSGKPGEGLCDGFVPDLQRTARMEDEY